MHRLTTLLFLAVCLLSAAPAAARGMSCKTPRAAVDSVFTWQQPNRRDLMKATTCLERTGRSPAQLNESAQKLKRVYDSMGAWVVMENIPVDPEYIDEEKNAVVLPHADLPDVVVEKRGDNWVWTAESLDRIDDYYENVGALIQTVDRLPTFFVEVTVLDVALWQYLALVLLVLSGVLVRQLLAAVVAARIKRLGDKIGRWPSKLVDVVASPGATLVTAVILRIGYPQLMLPVSWAQALAVTVRILITISILWATYRSTDLLAAKLAERAERTDSKLDDQLVPMLRKTLKVIVFAVGTLLILQNLKFDVTTLFASVSIGGLALGLAAKDTLANLFGSISIFVDSPFQIGDWINVEGVDGMVEEVGFRSTRIRTFYNSVAVLPNATLANTKIDNYGLRQYRRCFVTLGLTYDTSAEQMQAFVEGCRAIIHANPLTRKDAFEVHMSGFGDSSLNVMLYFFFKCETWTDELRERHNVYLEILRLAQDLGVSFAFPTQSLHIESMRKPTDPASRTPLDASSLREIVDGYGPGGSMGRPEGPEITQGKHVPQLVSARGSESN